MALLTPNAPAKRLGWVLKTYLPKYPVPVTDTFLITVFLLGQETGPLRELADDASDYAYGAAAQGKDRAVKIRDEYLLPMVHKLADVRNENDFLIPWIAKQLVDLWRASGEGAELLAAHVLFAAGEEEANALPDVGAPTQRDYTKAVDTLERKAPAIAMWARETKQNIGRVTLAQALDAIATYEFKTALVPQGDIVYTFPDGYTVQELRAEAQLRAEGTEMQHCVGSYAEQVEEGRSHIFSLRDAHGNPHVTMEWLREPGDDSTDLRSSRGHFIQIYGKQNEPPADKYKPYVQKFIYEHFNGDPVSLIRAGVAATDIDMTNLDLRDLELSGLDLTYADLSGSSLAGAFLNAADFQRAILRGVVFDHARMAGADMRGADVTGASFKKTRLDGSTWTETIVEDADFSGAVWGDVLSSGRFDGAIGDVKYTEHTAFGALREPRKDE